MIIDWILNLVNLSDFAPGESQDVGQTRKLRHLSTEYIATTFSHCDFLVSEQKNMRNWIWSYHIISYTRSPLFHKRIWATFQPHQRHLPAPAPMVGLPHPLPPARGAGGGRSGGNRPRFWARRSKHGKRHLDGSPPAPSMETWRFEIMHQIFRCFFFRSPLFFFDVATTFPVTFVLVLCRTPFLELVQPEFLQNSRVFQTFQTGFCFSQQPSLSITTISRVTFHLSSTSQAVRRLRSCSFPQRAGGTASRLSGKNVRLGRAARWRLSFLRPSNLIGFEGSSSQNWIEFLSCYLFMWDIDFFAGCIEGNMMGTGGRTSHKSNKFIVHDPSPNKQ